jgi:hypothetical protein
MNEDLINRIPNKPQLDIGSTVVKHGAYQWRGVVCSVFGTPDGLKRVVVAHRVDKGYVLHIYRPEQLEIVLGA